MTKGVVYINYVDDKISSVIIPECDIKKFIIKRTDHEDLEIKVNGGTYRDA